jgi:hypothetical protein
MRGLLGQASGGVTVQPHVASVGFSAVAAKMRIEL